MVGELTERSELVGASGLLSIVREFPRHGPRHSLHLCNSCADCLYIKLPSVRLGSVPDV